MAAGDRKVKITRVEIITNGGLVVLAEWSYRVENKLGVDEQVKTGRTRFTPSWVNATTYGTQKTEVRAAVLADPDLPANDDVS